MKRLSLPVFAALFLVLIINSCKHEPKLNVTEDSGYPPEIAKILVTRCTNGCHNAANASASGGLRLDLWDKLFDGGNQGAVIIPYDTLNSSFLYYINTDTSLGLTAEPRMPYSPDPAHPEAPLSREEYLTIRHWIATGGPDKNGIVPFAANPDTRQKVYLTEQACDYLSVIDAERHVIMRNIRIGVTPNVAEIAHCVRVDKQGRYAYVSFTSGNELQKIDTWTDQIVGSVALNVPGAQWNILHPSDDGHQLLVTGFTGNVAKVINTDNMTVTATISNARLLSPHGIAATPAFDTFFVTGQYGNKVYRCAPSGYLKVISIDGKPANADHTVDPHEIMMTPDHNAYFLTCESSNEVRVMDAHADTLMYVFNTPAVPQEIAISPKKQWMFVTCMEAQQPDGSRGAVVVIDYASRPMRIIKTLSQGFFQPHGITVDDQRDLLYVASRNFSPGGPAPHHSSNCGGANGWYDVYNVNTWQKVSSRLEAMPDCYSLDTRFKQ